MIDLSINVKQQVDDITQFIEETLKNRGFQHVVVACSGGVDSSTTLLLAVRSLGAKNVFPLLMPYRDLNKKGLRDARDVVEKAGVPGVNVEVIDIGPMVDAFAHKLGLNKGRTLKERVRLGNVMARCRMTILYDKAKRHEALVLGTENKSEYLLGYFTRFGDEASDVEPIRHLYKTQVYLLASHLGVPQSVVKREPTAGLWQGQTDERELGFTYEVADQILHALYDEERTVSRLVSQGFRKEDIVKIKDWIEANQFKHELPIVAKI